MRVVLSLLFLMLLGAGHASAQVFDDFDKPLAAADQFCRIMDTIQRSAPMGFNGIQEPGTVLTDTVANNDWEVKKSLWFPGANNCEVFAGPSGRMIFQATFMSRDEQDGLVSSYNNLLRQVQDCLPQAYTAVNKKRPVYDKFFPVYDTELSYTATGLKSDKPVYRIYIYHNLRLQNYQLRMEITSL
jgi:hypothetical protein